MPAHSVRVCGEITQVAENAPTVPSAKSHTNPKPHGVVGEAGGPGRPSGGLLPGAGRSWPGLRRPRSRGPPASLVQTRPGQDWSHKWLSNLCVRVCVAQAKPMENTRGPARPGDRAAVRHDAAQSHLVIKLSYIDPPNRRRQARDMDLITAGRDTCEPRFCLDGDNCAQKNDFFLRRGITALLQQRPPRPCR